MEKPSSDPVSPPSTCPYIGTIRRELLDFDLPKVCGKTLNPHNAYACLVCGMYLHGRGKDTPAYIHSLHTHHYLYLHLTLGQVYCLPDLYEVSDPSLTDIKFNLNPLFSPQEISDLDKTSTLARAVDGTYFIPGTVGLNNLKATDYINVVLQVLFSIKELRTVLMLNLTADSTLTGRVGELFRRMMNPRAFRSHVAPYQAVRAIEKMSQTFQRTTQGDPQALWTWLINTLIAESAVAKTVKKCFKGKLSKRTEMGKTETPFL